MKHQCIVFGAGSIGKSVAGYCFNKACADVTFTDIDRASVDDINRRGFYRVYISDSEYETVSGVSAIYIEERDALIRAVAGADYVCTSVGAAGLESALELVALGIRERGAGEPLYIILCENIPDCHSLARGMLNQRVGGGEFAVVESSVERMTKPRQSEAGERDVLAEPFIPFIVNRKRYIKNAFFDDNPELFFQAENFASYYYRKIHTNNLGHAVLGYLGFHKGYKYLAEAFDDPCINGVLKRCLDAAGRMLTTEYGFTQAEMKNHTEALMTRLSSKNLCDETARVIRGPLRKLSRDERIIGTAKKAAEAGIYSRELALLAAAALTYFDPEDGESARMRDMLEKDGIDRVLTDVCGLDKGERLFGMIKDEYRGMAGHD